MTPTSPKDQNRPTAPEPPIQRRFAAAIAALALITAACGGSSAATDDRSVASLAPATSEEAPTNGDTLDDPAADDPAPDDTARDELTPEQAQLAFEQCLEDKGIQASFGSPDGESISGGAIGDGDGEAQMIEIDGRSDESFDEFEAAMDECGALLGDAFGDFDMSPEQEAAMADAELAFGECMREQGFPIETAGEGGGISFQIESDPNDPDGTGFEAALDECEKVFEEIDAMFSEENS